MHVDVETWVIIVSLIEINYPLKNNIAIQAFDRLRPISGKGNILGQHTNQ